MTTLETVCDDYWYPNFRSFKSCHYKGWYQNEQDPNTYGNGMCFICSMKLQKNPVSVSKFTSDNNVYFEGKD